MSTNCGFLIAAALSCVIAFMNIPVLAQEYEQFQTNTPTETPTLVVHLEWQVCPYIPSAAGMNALERAIYNNETAMGRNIRDSRAGAIGPMQIMPTTFEQYARPGEDIHNPNQNMEVGRRIIAALKLKYHNNVRAIMIAYNAGEKWANRWLAFGHHRKSIRLPAETRMYLVKGIAYMAHNPDLRHHGKTDARFRDFLGRLKNALDKTPVLS